MRERLGIWLATLALALGSLLLAVAVAEGIARLTWTPPRPVTAPPRPVPEEWQDLPQQHSVLAMSKPNARFLVAGTLFETNEHGFRGPSRPRAKPADTARMIIVGDSFAMGWGVLYEETYAARLERSERLVARSPGRLEVLNFGLAGDNAQDAVERLEAEAIAFAPDIVVYGANVNDVEGEHYAASFPRRAGPSMGSVLWQIVGPRLVRIAELVWPPPGSYLYELDENYFRNPPAWQAFEAALDDLARIAKAHEACPVVLIQTQLHRLDRWHPYDRHYAAIQDAALARDLPVVPTRELFRDRETRSLWVSPTDAHPNATAHALLADALVEPLASLPRTCWR